MTGVAGHVTVVGGGVAATISAQRTDPDHPLDRAEIETNALGNYLLPLVPGRYILQARGDSISGTGYWSVAGPTASSRGRDTLVVREGERTTADFVFGRFVARLDGIPGQFDGASANLVAFEWSPSRDLVRKWSTENALIRSGSVLLVAPGVPVGLYCISVNIADTDVLLWLPGTVDRFEADTIRIAAGATTEYAHGLAVSSGRIRGVMHGSWERLGPGTVPRVLVFSEDSLCVLGADPESDGSFEFSIPLLSGVRLCTLVNGITRWMGGETFAEATTFRLEPGTVTEVPPYTDSALLIRLVPPDPWTSIRSRCLLVNSRGQSFQTNSGTDTGDLLLVSNLGPGSYRVRVTATNPGSADWLPQWFNGADSLAAAEPVEIPPEGQVARVTMRLVRAGGVSGVVVDPDGPMFSKWQVVLTPAGSGQCWVSASISSRAFGFRGLPDGDWKIGAKRIDGHWTDPFDPSDYTWYGGASWDSAAVITIRDHRVVDGIEIRLP